MRFFNFSAMIAVASGLLIFGLGLAWLWAGPAVDSVDWYPKCIFYQATGLHCPGCGGTRAVRALARGDLPLAIRSNPMLIFGVPIMLALVSLQRRREYATGKASPRFTLAFFAVLVVYFVARNVPSPTTSPFAPPTGINDKF